MAVSSHPHGCHWVCIPLGSVSYMGRASWDTEESIGAPNSRAPHDCCQWQWGTWAAEGEVLGWFPFKLAGFYRGFFVLTHTG